jgi:hypothetical protein
MSPRRALPRQWQGCRLRRPSLDRGPFRLSPAVPTFERRQPRQRPQARGREPGSAGDGVVVHSVPRSTRPGLAFLLRASSMHEARTPSQQVRAQSPKPPSSRTRAPWSNPLALGEESRRHMRQTPEWPGRSFGGGSPSRVHRKDAGRGNASRSRVDRRRSRSQPRVPDLPASRHSHRPPETGNKGIPKGTPRGAGVGTSWRASQASPAGVRRTPRTMSATRWCGAA